MQRTKIEWADYVWNPIKGICPVGCWYCYARKIYRRFKLDQKPWLDVGELNQLVASSITGKRIFVCSTFELFHPVIDNLKGRIFNGNLLSARDLIFNAMGHRPDLTFIILTKMPERIDRPMPDNVWLGVSVTGKNQDDDRIRLLCLDAEAPLKFISFEPLREDVAKDRSFFADYINCFSWVIVGRLTGYGRIHDPTKANIARIVEKCREAGIPVFLKNNLQEIWKGPLIQEWPSEKVSDGD